MPASLTFQTIVSGLQSAGGSKIVSDDGAELASPTSVLAAQPGTLSTRTSNVAGTLTMTNADHGIVTGQRFDLYWTGGSCFGVIAGTVSGTSIPFTRVQGGDVLPTASTSIIVGIAQSVSFSVVGDRITALVCGKASELVRCYYVFLEASNILGLAVLNQAGRSYVWDGTTKATGPVGSGPVGSASISAVILNPLSNINTVEVYISHANTSAADTGLATIALKHA
jgi:hypothetical protein